MTVEFRAGFACDLRTIRDAELLARIQAAVEAVEQAEKLQDVPNLIKMQAVAATTVCVWATTG